MRFTQLPYEVSPGGATEAVIHIPLVIIITTTSKTGPGDSQNG